MKESICRYCMEENADLFPCNCSTPICRKCLEKWSNTRNINDVKKCEICKAEYKIEIIIESNYGTIVSSSDETVKCITCVKIVIFVWIIMLIIGTNQSNN